MSLLTSTFRTLRLPLVCAAFALLAVSLSGQAARAFTFNNADGSSGNDAGSGYSGYKDIDVNRSRLNGNSGDSASASAAGRPKSGFYFGGGGQAFDERYSADRYFSPNNLMGR